MDCYKEKIRTASEKHNHKLNYNFKQCNLIVGNRGYNNMK